MTDLNSISRDRVGSTCDPRSGECELNDNSVSKPQQVVELLYLLKLGVKTNLRWIGRDKPDIDAARMTSARLCQYVDRLEMLLEGARDN